MVMNAIINVKRKLNHVGYPHKYFIICFMFYILKFYLLWRNLKSNKSIINMNTFAHQNLNICTNNLYV